MFVVRGIGRPQLALDRASARTFDLDGRLHVAVANISKANVCEYLGSEIPDAAELGLQADKLYRLYRDPDELAMGASSFNNLPVLSRHVPVDARDHHPELVIGSSGTDARFAFPFLTNSLVIWAADAIGGIESGSRRELSSAYRYAAIMIAGTSPEGEKFDGRMTKIIGNHIAVIPEGRCGPSVAIDEARFFGRTEADDRSYARRFPHAARISF